MSRSLRARLVEKIVWKMRARADRVQDNLQRLRADFEFAGRYQPRPRGVSVSHRIVEGVAVEVLMPKVRNPKRVLMYLHGGGYVIGSPRTHRAFAMTLAKALAAEVWVPDYRLAPEHPYPAAQEDAIKVWRVFAETFPDQVRLLAGESAGGGLSVATALRARDEHVAMPHALYLISPWLDVTLTARACRERDQHDALLGYAFTDKVFAGNYCRQDQRRSPGVSPLFAELTGLPPTLVQVGEHEILYDDSISFADKARQAGVEVTLEEGAEMWHAWVLFAALVPEAKASLRSAVRWLNARTG